MGSEKISLQKFAACRHKKGMLILKVLTLSLILIYEIYVLLLPFYVICLKSDDFTEILMKQMYGTKISFEMDMLSQEF